MTVANTIDEIDRKILTIKHALNLTNATAKVRVGDQEMSVDGILIRMAQLNKRKTVLDDMRKRLPKRESMVTPSVLPVRHRSISISTTIQN